MDIFWAWLAAHIVEIGILIATGMSALYAGFEWRAHKARQLPFIELNISPAQGHSGWLHFALIVRNFNPYAVYVTELQIKRPRTSALFNEFEAFERSGSPPAFVASDAVPKLKAEIRQNMQPVGAMSPGFANVVPPREIDQINRAFYYSPGPGIVGRIKVKMVLICEVRSRDVRTKKIAISRTITL